MVPHSCGKIFTLSGTEELNVTLTRRQVFATTSILAGAGVAGALLGASSVAQAAAEIDRIVRLRRQ